MNIAIPSTFTRPFAYKKTRQYDKIDNAVQIFSEVKPTRELESGFAAVVERLGNTRAWLQDYRNQITDKLKVTINNLKIGIESKNYNPAIFERGTKQSRLARQYYMRNSKDKVYIEIESDLIFVHKNQDGEWVKCGREPVVGAVKTTERDFNKWETTKRNVSLPDFHEWLRLLPKSELSPPIIKIHVEK